eukprot:2903989-Pyramimonas_sp.AAC.2
MFRALAICQDLVPNAATLFASGNVYEPGDAGAINDDDDDEFELVSAAARTLESLPAAVQQRVGAAQRVQAQGREAVAATTKEFQKRFH